MLQKPRRGRNFNERVLPLEGEKLVSVQEQRTGRKEASPSI